MKNYLILRKVSLFIGLFVTLFSCVEPFEIKYDLNQKVIIVEGVLSDEIGDQIIIIKQSSPNLTGSSSQIIGLEKANVEILVNNTEKIQFTESTVNLGNYIGPPNFRAVFGNTYQLLITTAQGQKFASKIEKIKKGSEVKKVYQKFEAFGKPLDKNYKVQHSIYLDTEDPATKGDNYLWKWKLFEAQDICRTCEPQERYYPTPYPGRCVKDLPNFLRNTIYDYQCASGGCWEIIHSLKSNVMTDDFSNGKTITGRLIAEIPLYQLNAGALIQISQQSIDVDAYKYMKILIDQNQNSGGLADTPPVSLVGNITSVDGARETVAGYFRVTDESVFKYWIDRRDAIGEEIRPIGLLGRAVNLEPTGSDTTRPPFAPCIEGYTRTNKRPVGWQDSK